jgi:hypothetical protein
VNFFSFYCPVPFEQRPINEYLRLKNSFILCWPTLANSAYLAKVFYTFFFSFFISTILVLNFISFWQYPIKFILLTLLLTSFQVLFLFIYIKINWKYIKDRLYNPTIFYEESSWYDGKIWIKPASILKQERLISYYQITPLLIRINKIIEFLILMIIINILSFFIF